MTTSDKQLLADAPSSESTLTSTHASMHMSAFRPAFTSADIPTTSPMNIEQHAAKAFWFGDADTPLLAWYHPPKTAMRNSGVVLCPPFGHEYMVSYLSYKHLAMQLAEAGFPVCFFDYDGCGDSAQSDTARVAAWQHNIRQAAEQLRRLSGVKQISLFGMRMGALLAAGLATELASPALLMLAPVISGRAYVRELMVLRGMSGVGAAHKSNEAKPSEHSVSDDQLTGYTFCASTRAALSELNILNLASPPAAVMIAARDDISGQEAKLATTWRRDEYQMHLITTPGYAAMMTEDAHESSVPHAIWAEMCQWLIQQIPLQQVSLQDQQDDTTSTSANMLTTRCRIRHGEQVLQEEIVQFDGMVGIVTQPSPTATSTDIGINTDKAKNDTARPAIILTNVGANHRVGNHRLYVTMARTLAAQGFTVLRYDKRGIGYSQPTPEEQENDVHGLQGVEDIGSAMQFMQQAYRQPSFVLAGLCSGAYLSYLAAVHDPRVTGLVLMNQLTFHWRTGNVIQTKKAATFKSTQFYFKAATHGNTWRRMLRGKIASRKIFRNLAKKLIQKLLDHIRHRLAHFMKTHHLLGPVARNFKTMQARGVELVFVFDANDSSIDLMTKHLGSNAHLLQHRDSLKIEVINGVDHTFTPMWSQTYLATMLAQHLAKRFP
ncbi:alpha-beta hydrolase superfamily lysophospholipase [Undibacterium sp. GrIS 1.2]|uniref:alpha/beta fold hydrolase n=1 Tax=Undibacterium sp. GrIS 1.2 TaxID=3143933 RepID=UPI00339562B0